MSNQDFAVSIVVDETPETVFAAIRRPGDWWNASIQDDGATVGNVLVHQVPDIHYCKMTVREAVGDERIVWHVDENTFSFVNDQKEWVDTDIVFDVSRSDEGKTELRFTHVGLTSQDECYELCSDAWGGFIRGSLHKLITTGFGSPIGGGNEDHERLVAQAKSR
jgi:hypothetical protein